MSFVLAHEIIGNPTASHVAYLLHGVLGSGQNFRGFAKQLQKRRSDFCFVLPDLRNHGSSSPAPPPHTLQACAQDIVELSDHLKGQGISFPTALIGHSFGGKVALAAAGALNFGPAEQVFLLDANPGSIEPEPDHEVLKVIRAVRSIPTPATSRAEVVQALVGKGLSSGLANWMTTNLKRQNGAYIWVFDLDAIELLLQDYFATDLWPTIKDADGGPEIQIVVAENSARFNPKLRERAAALGSVQPNVHVHTIPKAGHWLHVDNPQALLDLLCIQLRSAA